MVKKLVWIELISWSDGATNYNWDKVDLKIIVKYHDFF